METVMMSKATFNNISVISWRSVLVEETGVSGEKHIPSRIEGILYSVDGG
jgi:hypothetical protein